MLSIVIPTLNEEKYLPILLASIKSQDFNDYEIIVADNSSSDGTIEIARSFDCEVVKGGTLCEGRNRGAEAAKGGWILFMDADTKLSHGALKQMVTEFQKRKLDIASFYALPFKDKKILRLLYFLIYNLPTFVLQRIIPFGYACFLVKKEIHEKIGGFDEKVLFLEDFPYLRLAVRNGARFGFLARVKIFVSERRYEEDGWIKAQGKILLAIAYTILFGPVKKDIFRYHFGKHQG